RPELYDFGRDPRETHNIASDDRRTLADLRAQLAQFGSRFTAPDAIDHEEAKKLASLGYVSAGTSATPTIDPKDRIADLEALRRLNSDDVAAMEQLLARNPYWSDLRDQLGAAYARRAASETHASLPPRFHYVAGDAFAHAGKIDDAVKEMDAEIATDSHDVQAYADRALLDVVRGDHPHAIAILEAMARANPSAEV